MALRHALSLLLVRGSAAAAGAVPLILDTDMGGGGCQDVDDVGALCLANALADNGEVRLLAVAVDTSPRFGVGVVSVLNRFYGRDEVPIGAYKGTGLNPDAPALAFVEDLVKHWPARVHSTDDARDAVDLYREVLSKEADASVVVASVGLLTNLAALFESKGDARSPLAGRALFARKVRRLAIMAGHYGNSTPALPRGACNNFCGCYDYMDPLSVAATQEASAAVINSLPANVEVIYSGMEVGKEVQTGARLETCMAATNPCRRAYLDYRDDLPPGQAWTSGGRSSWDPLTVLAAVRGPAAVGTALCDDCNGVNFVNASNGQNVWRPGLPANQTYLVLRNATAAAAALDDLYCQLPRRTTLHV